MSKTKDITHRVTVISGQTPSFKQSDDLALDQSYPYLKGVRIHPVNQYANQFNYRIGIAVDGEEYFAPTFKNDFFATPDVPMSDRTRKRDVKLRTHKARLDIQFPAGQGDLAEPVELDVVFELSKEPSEMQ